MQVVKNSASQTYDPNKRSKPSARLSFYHPQVTQVIIHRLQVTRIHLDSEFRSLAKYGILDKIRPPESFGIILEPNENLYLVYG